MLKQRSGAALTHIPYKGGGQAMQDVLGNNIPLVYTAIAGASQSVKAGRVNAIAVSSGKRDAALPNVPTMKESGYPDMVVDSWVALLAPAKTPTAIIERLQRRTAAALAQPEVRDQLLGLGITPVGNTPEEFGAQLAKRFGEIRGSCQSGGDQGGITNAARGTRTVLRKLKDAPRLFLPPPSSRPKAQHA